MHRQHFLIGCYTALLRLYPQNFRAEYADEMTDVFALSVQEKDGALGLMSLCAGELRDLPVGIIREHLAEREAQQLSLLQEGIMTQQIVPVRVFRFCTWTLMIVFALYCLFVILPFFLQGIQRVSLETIQTGTYEIRGYPSNPDNNVLMTAIWFISLVTLLIAPIWTAAMGGILGLTLRLHWGKFNQRQRLVGSASLLAGFAILALLLTPLGRIIFIWFMD